MALTLEIDSVDVLDYVSARSLQVKGTAYQQTGTLTFQLQGEPDDFSVSVEDEVVLADGATRYFGGIIRSVKRRSGPKAGWVVIDVTAQDYTTLLGDDVIDGDGLYPATLSDGDDVAIEHLLDTWGSKSITATNVAEVRSTMPTIDFTGMTIAEAVKEIASLSAAEWYVDYSKDLHYFESEADAAAFGLSDEPNDSTTYGYTDFELPDESTGLRNAVYFIPSPESDLSPTWYTDDDSITAYGRREATLRDERVTVQDTMDSKAASFLAEHATPRRTGSLVTWKAGLRPGMDVQITNADHGLSAESFRITGVTMTFPTFEDAPRFQIEFGDRPISLAHQLGNISTGVADVVDQVSTVVGTIADLSVGGGNQVRNSSFESGSEGSWTVGSEWAFGHVSDDPLAGDKSAAVELTGTDAGELVSDYYKVARTDDWWVSWWSYLSAYTAGTAVIEVREYDGTTDPDPTLLATHTVELTAAQSLWTRHALHFGPNDVNRIAFHDDTTHVAVAFLTEDSAELTWEVDAVQIERGNVLTAYAPAPQELVDGQITETQIGDAAITTPKLAAGAVVSGTVAAGAISAEHIAAEGISADQITSGELTLGGIEGVPDVLVVLDADGEEIGRWGEDGLLITDATNDMLKIRMQNGVIEFSPDGGTTWTTAISGEGISADSIKVGTLPGAHNMVPNSGFEIADFASPGSKVWTSATDWQSHLTGDLNITDSGTSLTMNDETY